MAKNKNKKNKKPIANRTSSNSVEKLSPQVQKRLLHGAITGRLTGDWQGTDSINIDLQLGLKQVRSRSRELSVNDPIARRYLKMIKSNVVGPDGIQLSVQATNPDQSMDSYNTAIENHFLRWGRSENCTTRGKFDWVKTQELALESMARDGEALVRLCRGPQFGKYFFQIQLMDADHLDENYNTVAENGNTVMQGVELNSYGRAVAYYLWKNNPADSGAFGIPSSNERERVLAEDILHVFDPERASQIRGYPWLQSAMTTLHHMRQYREAELIAARIAANKQVFYKQMSPEGGFANDGEREGVEDTLMLESAPGTHEVLPVDMEVQTVDFSNPNSNFVEFTSALGKAVASGLNVSSYTLTNSLEGVNYSSARFGGMEDQAQYRSLQSMFINSFIKPIYEEWLKMQLLTNNWGLNIPATRFDKFNQVRYIARRWASVDPVKDLTADIGALNNCLTSVSDVITNRGGDPEEVFLQIAKDKERMAALDITPTAVLKELADLAVAQAAIDQPTETDNKKK